MTYERSKTINLTIAQKFSSGFIMAKIMEKIEMENAELATAGNLGEVKDTRTGIEIIHNWNRIFLNLENVF